MHEATLGLLMIIVAGVMNGSFAVPMKLTHRWQWEHTWLMWTIYGPFIFPPLLTFFTIPNTLAVYQESGLGVVAAVAACGAGWGISVVFIGLAVEAVGVAVSFSIMLGLSAALGSLVPLVVFHRDKIATPAGMSVLGGLALVLIGVGACAVAGKRREMALGARAPGKTSIAMGLTFCVLGGIGSGLVNLGLVFGAPILKAAEAHGASRVSTPNAAFLPLMLAGGIPSLIYCSYLIFKNKNVASIWRSPDGSPLVPHRNDGFPVVRQHNSVWRCHHQSRPVGRRIRLAAVHVRDRHHCCRVGLDYWRMERKRIESTNRDGGRRGNFGCGDIRAFVRGTASLATRDFFS